MKTYIILLLGLLIGAFSHESAAAPPATSPFIKVDQFGYFPTSKKVAVISNPKQGFNGNQSFSPATGANRYQVRRWSDGTVVFRGTLSAWNQRNTHTQSGDQGWWFDFSAVTEPGSYYVYDPRNKVGSGRFEINKNVYDEVLKQAVRMFYYQRVNFAKEAPYAGKWTDGAAFDGPNQDKFARSVNAKGDPSTARDLSGGWFDAGDLNKYTTFTFETVSLMLEAYRMHPAVFRDNYNIPESGNGVADLLDEVKYELDWLKRMQDATNTDGFMLKVGAVTYNDVSPPSQDAQARYYVGECTSATIAGAAVFALGGLVYRSLPQSALANYGNDLIARAERAWGRARTSTEQYTAFGTECDSQEIRAGDADQSAQKQKNQLLTAAVYLYEATGRAEYRTYVEDQYAQVTGIREGSPNLSWPYAISNAFALLHYTTLPNVSSGVAQTIAGRKADEAEHSLADYQAKKDLYRAHMEDRAHHWGSNIIRANSGGVLLDFSTFNVNSSDKALYREAAEQYAHWLHGVNPLGLVMLTNMYGYGAERSVNEMAHAWFNDNTKYDNAQTSEVGPAPGYLTGGPNKDYPLSSVSPPYGQPPQKSYRDWNTDADQAYAITEPAIYYQASYVALLSRLIGIQDEDANVPPGPPTVNDPRYVFQDALADGWQNWSWSSDIDLTQLTVVQEGSRAMKVAFQAAGGGAGVSLRSEEAISTDGYQAIQLAVQGGDQTDQSLRVYIQTEDAAGGSAAKIIIAPAGQWQEVTVPLRELGNPAAIKRITLENNSAQTNVPFYVDNLRLVAQTADEAANLVTSATVQVYPNELGDYSPLQLRWNEASSVSHRVEVINQQGRTTYQTVHQGAQLQIDRAYFPQGGIYIVRVYPLDQNAAGRVESFKILVR